MPHPRTILEGVNKLPPAHYAVWHEGKLQVERYWSPDWNRERRGRSRRTSTSSARRWRDAVREQMIADVPLGAFLSGGIDSTIIVGLMQQASSRPVKTFAIGFPDPAYDETRYAELAARHLGTEHQTFMRRAEGLGDAARPGLAVRRAVRRQLGAAHLARRPRDPPRRHRRPDRRRRRRAVRRLRSLPGARLDRAVPSPARDAPALDRRDDDPRPAAVGQVEVPAPRPGAAASSGSTSRPGSRYLGWMTTFDETGRLALYTDAAARPAGLDRSAPARPGLDRSGFDPEPGLRRGGPAATAVTQAMVGDILTYLPGDLLVKVDMASMAHSLECRGPFLDHRVVELAAAMPLDRKLRFRPGPVEGRAQAGLRRPASPSRSATRRKMGFGVPVGRWFRDELKDELRQILLDRVSLDRGLFRPEVIQRLDDEHVEGRREHGHRLWALVMLELWFRNHMDGRSGI